MNKDSKIYVAGHNGLVGSAFMRVLRAAGYTDFILKKSSELDLRNQADVEEFFAREKPDYVFLAAAKVGGILANSTYAADFAYDNIMIATNVIHAAYVHGVKKLLNLGSSCIYPKFAPQPMSEDYLLTGALEPTNEPYAVAKIAAIKLCSAYNKQYGTDFISVMPTNMYGPDDNFDLETSHVLPAMIRKFHMAKVTSADKVTLWGTGTPMREFLYADDLAEACLFLMKEKNVSQIGETINIGYGKDITIKDLAELIKDIVGFDGTIEWDSTKPDGMPRKLMDSSRINALGWKPKVSLKDGITRVYREVFCRECS